MNYNIETKIKSGQTNIFNAIVKHLDDWWGKTDGELNKAGDKFTISFGNSYWKFRVIDFVENRKISWECIDGEPEFNREWIGSKIHWIISESEKDSIVRMEHFGLTPQLDCYDICSVTWDKFIGDSLKSFVETGVGKPHE